MADEVNTREEKCLFNGIDVERQKLAEFQRRCAEGLRRQREGNDSQDEKCA
jgi:hypothetical protein